MRSPDKSACTPPTNRHDEQYLSNKTYITKQKQRINPTKYCDTCNTSHATIKNNPQTSTDAPVCVPVLTSSDQDSGQERSNHHDCDHSSTAATPHTHGRSTAVTPFRHAETNNDPLAAPSIRHTFSGPQGTGSGRRWETWPPEAPDTDEPTYIPDDFDISEYNELWIEDQQAKGYLLEPPVEAMLEWFIEDAETRDVRRRNWDRAFRQWLVLMGGWCCR